MRALIYTADRGRATARAWQATVCLSADSWLETTGSRPERARAAVAPTRAQSCGGGSRARARWAGVHPLKWERPSAGAAAADALRG
jgi:hypothetical protein